MMKSFFCFFIPIVGVVVPSLIQVDDEKKVLKIILGIIGILFWISVAFLCRLPNPYWIQSLDE